MRIMVSILALGLSFSAMAKSKTDYKFCQEAVDNLFTVDNLIEDQLTNGLIIGSEKSFPELEKGRTPLFSINEKGELDEEESKVQESFSDESTGVYRFRLNDDLLKKEKAKYESNMLSMIKAEEENYKAKIKSGIAEPEKGPLAKLGVVSKETIPEFDVKLREYIVKKDDNGRVFSIEEVGNRYCESCSRKVEFAYSKKKCLPKNVIEKNSNGENAIAANAVVCKNMEDIKKQLFKKMKKFNKCTDVMNKYYREAEEKASIMISELEQEVGAKENFVGSDLNKSLHTINENAALLRESDDIYEIRNEAQSALQKSYDQMLDNCDLYLGKGVVDTGSVYKNKKGVFEIKKDRTGRRVENPLDELRKVKKQ